MMMAVGLTPKEFMLGLMGKQGDPSSGGRQMPSHWSLRRANVVSHSSPVATQTTHAAGIGLGIKMRGEDSVVLTTVGEGSTSQGEWYEGVNWAAIHKLPVIFFVENNIYAISVPQSDQMAVAQVSDKAKGLGLPGVTVDGLDTRAVYAAVKEAVDRARQGQGPTLVEVQVNRMTPHSSDDDDRTYRSREEMEAMKKEDPLEQFQAALLDEGVLSQDLIDTWDEEAKQTVQAAVEYAEAADYPEVDAATGPVYAEEVHGG
jgi:2-oxoisovalerate dehydrogenase E1 component alpha subunit